MENDFRTELQATKSYARWNKAIKIDKLFREGFTREQIAEKLNLKLGYVKKAIQELWIDDVPKGFNYGE